MRFIGVRTWKTGIGAVIAMIIAKELGLSYGGSAGIITILSIQSTKRESLKIAIKRIESVIIALIVSSVLFLALGIISFSFYTFNSKTKSYRWNCCKFCFSNSFIS